MVGLDVIVWSRKLKKQLNEMKIVYIRVENSCLDIET